MSARIEQAALRADRERETAAAARRAASAEANFERLRAPFSLRCGALLIDYTIIAAIVAFATLLARLFGDDARWAGTTVLRLGYLLAAAAAVLNFVVLAAFAGRTLGKWVTGLHIVRRDGVQISFARAVLRHLVGYTLTLLTLGFGFLVAAFNIEGRALHDFIAGTVVVRERPRARGWR